jgi:hypothetical protein
VLLHQAVGIAKPNRAERVAKGHFCEPHRNSQGAAFPAAC